jgi:hypothetical protein
MGVAMFFEKMTVGLVGGVILGVIAMISSLSEGKSFGESLGLIPGGVVIGLSIALYWWFKSDDAGGHAHAEDQQIFKLQERLRSAVQSAIYAEERGDHASAAHFRAEAATLESRLRSLGA